MAQDTMTKSQRHLTLIAANRFVAAAVREAEQRQVNICVAVVDASGHMIAFQRMDDAALVSVDVAIEKARTAAYMKTDADFFESKINGGETALLSVRELMPLAGGVVIEQNGEIVGALGVSGSAGETDLAIAQKAAGVLKE